MTPGGQFLNGLDLFGAGGQAAGVTRGSHSSLESSIAERIQPGDGQVRSASLAMPTSRVSGWGTAPLAKLKCRR